MKILEVTNVDFALRQFLLPLMEGLRAAGHDVQGACADGVHLEDVRARGFVVHAVPMARSLSPVAQWRALVALIRLIRAERPDVVHGHMPISGILARVAARLCGVPVVAYTCHGFLFNQPGSRRRRALSLVLEWIAGQLTDLYMTVSREEAQDAKRLHLHRAPISIGNGRDPGQFHPDPQVRASVRAELGVPGERRVILAVSRLVRHKGYPELLRAMEDVRGDVELWIVGERLPSDHGDDMVPFFERASRELGPRLRILGYRSDVAKIMAAADIFVLPSHFEGLPMSIIEAMLTGLPVITTDIRGPREQVVSERTGLLVPPATIAPLARAIQVLVNDPERSRSYGTAGLERAKAQYDEAEIVARVVGLIEQTCDARFRKAP